MKEITLNMPAMYADHHVTEVRRILFELPGIHDVFASSSFHAVRLTYDEATVDPDAIRTALETAGYIDAPSFPIESEPPIASEHVTPRYFRHTAAYDHTRSTVSFAQHVAHAGRPLWPCPGMGPIHTNLIEDDNGHG